MNLFLLVLFALAVVTAWEWPYAMRFFVLAIVFPTLCLLLVQLAVDLWQTNQPEMSEDVLATADLPVDRSVPTRLVLYCGLNFLGWLWGLFGAIWLLGFQAAMPLFMVLYLKVQAHEGWLLSLVLAVIVVAVQYMLFDQLLEIHWPQGILLSWFEEIMQRLF